jgi:phosphinothricin acetyltransferase
MIRPATAADAAAVATIWNHYIRSTIVTFNPTEKTTAEVADLLAQPHAAFVATDATRIIGFARHFQFRGGAGYARAAEHTILLAPDAPKGRGTGRALMQAILDDATTRGIGAMIAAVSGDNAEGRAFHAAMGFDTVGLIPAIGWKNGRWLDLVLMQKRLAPSLAAR